MGLKDRLDRAERAAGEHFTTAVCPECGQTFRYGGDLALEVVTLQWTRETGTKHEADPTVERVLDHPHQELLDEVLSDIPALRRAR